MRRSHFVIATGFLVTQFTLLQSANATFHLMQIEQVIGGVNGDTTAQAIQLRMRLANQNLVQQGKLVVRNQFGLVPVTVATFPGPVPNHGTGVRILIASPNFAQYTSPRVVPDQTMSALIPASYLTSGTLTFENVAGTLTYWRLSWGGAMYFGPSNGTMDNDANGNFSPPFAGPLPSSNLTALRFTGTASAASNNNAADYAISASPAVFTNNAPASFTVTIPPPPCSTCSGDLDGNSLVDADDIQMFITCMLAQTPNAPACLCADQDDNHVLNEVDITKLVDILIGNESPEPPCL